MLLIGTQRNDKYIRCGAIASPKIYPDVEEREREAKTGGGGKERARGRCSPSSGSKREDLNAGWSPAVALPFPLTEFSLLEPLAVCNPPAPKEDWDLSAKARQDWS